MSTEANKNNEQQPEAQPALTSQDNPKNPFRDGAPIAEPSPAEEAEAEQQRKEALTERD